MKKASKLVRKPSSKPLMNCEAVSGPTVAEADGPAARTDARVVEVKIRLDDSARGAAFSNLQVEVTIRPD